MTGLKRPSPFFPTLFYAGDAISTPRTRSCSSSRRLQIRTDFIKNVGQSVQGYGEITEGISDRWAMFGVQLLLVPPVTGKEPAFPGEPEL
jgi:hypothetical protein